jgi:hypothetical protein
LFTIQPLDPAYNMKELHCNHLLGKCQIKEFTLFDGSELNVWVEWLPHILCTLGHPTILTFVIILLPCLTTVPAEWYFQLKEVAATAVCNFLSSPYY